jgi:hypothetical protein
MVPREAAQTSRPLSRHPEPRARTAAKSNRPIPGAFLVALLRALALGAA